VLYRSDFLNISEALVKISRDFAEYPEKVSLPRSLRDSSSLYYVAAASEKHFVPFAGFPSHIISLRALREKMKAGHET
jgi:hypothetical protein